MSSNKFDWKYYIDRYDDLGIKNKKQAIEHYKNYGKSENRFPNKITELNYINLKDKNNKIENNSFIDDISKQLETKDDLDTQTSISEIINISNEINEYSEIAIIKNDIKSIKNDISLILKLLGHNKDFSLPTNSNSIFESKNNVNQKSNIETSNDKVISSEEYDVCNNLSEDSNSQDKNSMIYSNEIENLSYDK